MIFLLRPLGIVAAPTQSIRPRRRRGPAQSGFSLIEILVAMAIVMIVMTMVYAFMRSSTIGYHLSMRQAERGMSTLNAVRDMADEVARAGYGLGRDVETFIPGLPRGVPTNDALTLRSNPEGVAGVLYEGLVESERLVRVSNADRFRTGDLVLLLDPSDQSERARVSASGSRSLAFESVDCPGDELCRAYPAGTRVLRLREVRYRLTQDPWGDAVLMKEVDDALDTLPQRVIARYVESLRFDYLDDAWKEIPPKAVRFWHPPVGVRVTLDLASEPGPGRSVGAPPLSHFARIAPQSNEITFDSPRFGFYLRRLFYDIGAPIGVASRPFLDTGTILALSTMGTTVAYTFPIERTPSDLRIDGVTPFPTIHDPAAVAFAPKNSLWAGSLIVVTRSSDAVRVWAVVPSATGDLATGSPVQPVARTSAPRSLGGVAFGADGRLYLSDPATGRVLRLLPATGEASQDEAEIVASIPGRPGPLARGLDGSVYVASQQTDAPGGARTDLWEIPFDADDTPETPRAIANLEGKPRSLITDPLSGALYLLVDDTFGDSVLLELSRWWLRDPESMPAPREAFRLSYWKDYSERTLPSPGEVRIPAMLFPPRLDFASFDALGAVYFGCVETQLVIQAELDRPEGVSRLKLGLAGIVGEDPETGRLKARLHAWKKLDFGL